MLNFGVATGEDVEIVNLIEDLEEMGLSGEILASSVHDNIAKVYEELFPLSEDNVEHFIDTVTEVADILEEYRQEYPVLYPSIGLIREMVIKFEEHEYNTD